MRSITLTAIAPAMALLALFGVDAAAQQPTKITDIVYRRSASATDKGSSLSNGEVTEESARDIKYKPNVAGTGSVKASTYALETIKWIDYHEAPVSYKNGFTAMEGGDWPQLATSMTEAIAEIEGNAKLMANKRVTNWLLPAAWFHKGFAHMKLNELDLARDAFEKVPTASRFLVQVAPALAGIYKKAQEYAKAADKYDEVRKLLEGDIKGSRTAASEPIERAYFQAYLNQCECLELAQKYADAFKAYGLYRKSIREDSRLYKAGAADMVDLFYRAWLKEGYVAFRQQQFASALSTYRAIVADTERKNDAAPDPRTLVTRAKVAHVAQAYNGMGDVELADAAGDPRRALRSYQMVTSLLNPPDEVLAYSLGKQVDCYRKIIETDYSKETEDAQRARAWYTTLIARLEEQKRAIEGRAEPGGE